MNIHKFSKYVSAPAMLLAMLAAASCADEVATPMAHIELDMDSIFAPSIESTIDFAINANCDWTITLDGEGSKWVRTSITEATGSANVIMTFESNDTKAPRTTVLNVANRTNTVLETIVITQNPASADGTISVSELRKLAANGTYTFNQDAVMRAVVMSNQQASNFFPNTLAVLSTLEAGNGITISTQEKQLLSPGEEIEVNLNGATVQRSATTGQMEVKPTSDAAITRTASTAITPKSVAISTKDLASGLYEGMLVSIEAQVSVNDMNKSNISGVLTMQDNDKNTFGMAVLPTSSFASTAVPVGSGTLTGIAVLYNGEYCIAPRTAADINLNAPRYDGGISLPYVLSFMTENANEKGRYINFFKNASDINSSYIMTKDGTGVTMKLNLSKAGNNQINFLFWADDSGHHNLQLGTFADGPDNDVIFVFPLDQDVTRGLRVQLGWGVQKNGCANWVVEYSTDCNTWYSTAKEGEPSFVIPQDMPYGSGKNYFNYTIDVPKPEIQIERRQTLYIKVRPLDKAGINGGVTSATGSYGRATAHSCVVIDNVPSFSTNKPAGALWFQPFDGLTEGADYRHGDKLCGLLNYCGNDIADWTTAQSMGMTGKNVRQRPGYAQIGYVESVYTDHKSLKNELGELCTPAVGAAGNYVISFDAMAYNNTSVFDKNGANTSKDFGGDSRQAVIEVIGGGTIDGATTKVIKDLSYTEFNNYTVTVEGATASSYIKFTSTQESAAYTRWFIDNICVKAK